MWFQAALKHTLCVIMFSVPTVNINSSEKSVNESLEGLGEIIVALAYTMILESLLKLISGHLSIL
jgi:hypothetical protein